MSVDKKPRITQESATSSPKKLNPLGLIVLVIIFSLAFALTYLAVFRSKPSQNSSDDVTLPSGRIVSPRSGSVFSQNNIPITVDASDDRSGVKNVEIFYKNLGVWQKLTTLTQPPFVYNWDVSTLNIQSVTLDIHVTDNAGNIRNTNADGWQEDIVIIPPSKGKLNQ